MEQLSQVISVLALWLPFAVTFVTEVAKKIPQVPVTSKNAKFIAFGLSVIGVLVYAYFGGSLKVDNAIILAGEVVATYLVSVGVYETVKKLVNKI